MLLPVKDINQTLHLLVCLGVIDTQKTKKTNLTFEKKKKTLTFACVSRYHIHTETKETKLYTCLCV